MAELENDTMTRQHQKALFIAENATVTGDVTLEERVSVWYGAVIRADLNSIHIAENTNIQDNVIVHVDSQHSTTIGRGVSIGHGAIIHGCTIEDYVIIGMGAVILSGAHIGRNSLIAAGAVVTENTHIPPHSLAVGIPAKVLREVGDDHLSYIQHNAEEYRMLAEKHARGEYQRHGM